MEDNIHATYTRDSQKELGVFIDLLMLNMLKEFINRVMKLLRPPNTRHENHALLGCFLKMRKINKNISIHPVNQQTGVQHFLKILMPAILCPQLSSKMEVYMEWHILIKLVLMFEDVTKGNQISPEVSRKRWWGTKTDIHNWSHKVNKTDSIWSLYRRAQILSWNESLILPQLCARSCSLVSDSLYKCNLTIWRWLQHKLLIEWVQPVCVVLVQSL